MASITIVNVLAEKSPQALPLGAACIVSYLKKVFETDCGPSNPKAKVILESFNLDDLHLSLGGASAHSDNSSKTNFQAAVDSMVEKLIANQSRIYSFSIFVWNRQLLCAVALELKKRLPDAFFLAGGPEVTANPHSFFPDKGCNASPFQYVISGEGEIATSDLISKLLFDSENPSLKENIIYGHRAKLALLSSPYLDGTLNPANYEGALWELARGCPFKCSYCYESKGEKTVDYFPLERIKAELDFFEKTKVPQIWVLDPTYNADKKRAVEMLDYIAKHAPDIFFHFECRAEFIDRELAKAFSKINCCMQIGLQSSDEEVLKLVHRGFNKKEFIKKVGILNETGIVFGFDLIYGLPGDSLQGFCNSIDFALSLYPNHLELFCLSVLPGTALFDQAEELHLKFESLPPYHVLETDKFSAKDLDRADKLSRACNLFYSQGRAVSWFNSVINLLKMKPSLFFQQFADFISGKISISDCYGMEHSKIEALQIEFIKQILASRNLSKYTELVSDIIRINGAYSRTFSDGKLQTVKLHYHPEDLMCEYAQDIRYFFQNCGKMNCTAETFLKNGNVSIKVK